jgi:hypothetical protein
MFRIYCELDGKRRLYWVLPDNNNGTPIQLGQEKDRKGVWIFDSL